MQDIRNIIEIAFQEKENISKKPIDINTVNAIQEVIHQLDKGNLRVAEKISNKWMVHQWIKKAILLSFLTFKNKIIECGQNKYFDKIKTKFSNWNYNTFYNDNIRIVPPATVRYGAYIAKNTVLMPSYVNIGAYVDEGTMIDTWSTVGSCAQIGKNVHLSGGVGIGGVLEPLQTNPTIIEDNCFIGARSEIVEGVIVEKNSVISMGVFIGQSTKIYDIENKKVYYGRIPEGSVVISGSLPAKNGEYSIYSAIIKKRIDKNTLSKIEINDLLRHKN